MYQMAARNNHWRRQIAISLLLVCLTVLFMVLIVNWILDQGHKTTGEQLSSFQPALSSSQSSIKLICAILTTNSTGNAAKSKAVTQTWAKRCDKYLLVKGIVQDAAYEQTGTGSSVGTNDKNVELNDTLLVEVIQENRAELWHKVIEMFEFLYEHHLHEFDWFMKADDDTFVLVDSLRHFLINRSSPHQAVYFGHRFKPFVRQGYMSGGSGYVLSREALRRLVELGFRKHLASCHLDSGSLEDVEMGRCLEAVGVAAGDTRDRFGRETFLPISPTSLLANQIDETFWYFHYAFYDHHQHHDDIATAAADNDNYQSTTTTTNSGLAPQDTRLICSNEPIAFHYVTPNEMYLIDWLLYDVRHRHCQAISSDKRDEQTGAIPII